MECDFKGICDMILKTSSGNGKEGIARTLGITYRSTCQEVPTVQGTMVGGSVAQWVEG